MKQKVMIGVAVAAIVVLGFLVINKLTNHSDESTMNHKNHECCCEDCQNCDPKDCCCDNCKCKKEGE